MNAVRETPFTLVMGALGPARFPLLREGIESSRRDATDRDAFLMVREVVELLREIEPDEGMGEGIATMAAFLHHAYLHWAGGERIVAVAAAELESALSAPAVPAGVAAAGSPGYVQLPPLRVWGVPVEGGPSEPLDGWFGFSREDDLSVMAIFGLHPGRAGFTAVEVAGPRPGPLARADGSALFSGTLPGAERAGLASVVGGEELLELAWRLAR